ncbi:MAG: hypothetical protein ACTSXH_07760 [Promethearchaeota archaeon]
MKLFSVLKKNLGFILIFLGLSMRIFMLFYYYYVHAIDINRSWGDVGLNFRNHKYYPPLTTFLLETFVFLSFGSIEIFAFWAFFWEFFTSTLFYFVHKRFKIINIKVAYGLYLLNPFLYINNIFSPINCGYHVTDSFFYLFFFLALIYYPQEEADNHNQYLFYLFLGLSMITKYYTLPGLGLIFLDLIRKKKWNDLKRFLITIPPIILILMVIPFFYISKYREELIQWYEIGAAFPFYLRIIPSLILFIVFLSIKKERINFLEILMFSIMMMGSFMFFSYPYLRWFQGVLFYGMLKPKQFFSLKIKIGTDFQRITIDNHVFTFLLSFFGVFLSFLMIIFIY